MRTADFDFELPPELVAQEPSTERDAARLLCHDVPADRTRHQSVRDLPEILRPGDLLVVNDTRVRPARLFGRRSSGGAIELLLLEPVAGAERVWTAFVNPARKLRRGEELVLEDGRLRARMIERELDERGEPAMEWRVELEDPSGEEPDVEALLERHGHVPLPPYIQRPCGGGAVQEELDRERYQTVFAAHSGAVAAPTAGLHFTPGLLERLAESGVERATVTLHVGPGTFRPVKAERVEDHHMHAERYELPEETARRIRATRERGGRIVACGTTTVRVLESCANDAGEVAARRGSTELFLHPGARFRVVDALLTNFHLPRSSLLMLVSAFAGRERVLRLYREAVAERYRFYSYGDAMLLLGPPAG